jgi:hypothetical protein
MHMHIRRRSAVIALLAAASALVFVIAANAVIPKGTGGKCSPPRPRPAGDNQSCINSQFLPRTGLSSTTRKAGSLEVRTNTIYAHPADKAHGGYAKKVVVFFDRDGTINPAATSRKCTAGQVAGKNPRQALVACGPLGTNNAWLLPSTSTVYNGTASATGNLLGCTLVFNGKPTAAGHPTVVLYARIWTANFTGCGNPKTTTAPGTTVTLTGVILNASAPFGKKLVVNNIDALPLALNDFDAKVKRSNYVSSMCSGHNGTISGSKYWKTKGTFTYSGGSTNGQPTDTAVARQLCSN